ncbi:hypothetical protein FQN50_008114 [Emmonsiellopsis sp. PD_5]|nr:hypothetical protein FQN50_008114 [Emmonsiellopsis sp. PD_5]
MHISALVLLSAAFAPFARAGIIPIDSRVFPPHPSFWKRTSCDLRGAVLPLRGTAPELPAPGSGLIPKHVALGRGTQNYTCADDAETTKPVAVGALATLYDVSCLVTSNPKALDDLTSRSLDLGADGFNSLINRKVPKGRHIEGIHYFVGSIPLFDYRRGDCEDWAMVSVSDKVPAPDGSHQGDNGAVDWLQLLFSEGSGIQQIYRVKTASGKAPSTCAGMRSNFEVKYAAQYWAYG